VLFRSRSVLDWYVSSLDLRGAGDLARAADALENARVLAPNDADLALDLARLYTADHRYGAAAAAYAEAALIAPERADVALAQARFHLGHAFRVQVAADAAARAARLMPDDRGARELLDRARTAAALASG